MLSLFTNNSFSGLKRKQNQFKFICITEFRNEIITLQNSFVDFKRLKQIFKNYGKNFLFISPDL